MKLIMQLGLVSALCWVSLCVERVLPFAMPASIIAMILLLVLLVARVVRVEWLRELSDFLLGNLPFFFVPVVVSVVKYLDVLKSNWVALVVICVVSTFATFAATAWTVRLTLRLLERRGK